MEKEVSEKERLGGNVNRPNKRKHVFRGTCVIVIGKSHAGNLLFRQIKKQLKIEQKKIYKI